MAASISARLRTTRPVSSAARISTLESGTAVDPVNERCVSAMLLASWPTSPWLPSNGAQQPRRIHVQIAATHRMTHRQQNGGNRIHAGTTSANYVDSSELRKIDMSEVDAFKVILLVVGGCSPYA